MKKRILTIALVIALLATCFAGTYAYLIDDDAAKNVMVVGNISIKQFEKERDASGALVDFTQNQPVVPAVGYTAWDAEGVDVNGVSMKVFDEEAMKNIVDKIVYVQNTGNVGAYIRTIVAIEAPDYDPNNLIGINYNSDATVSMSAPICVEVGGVEYVCFVFTYVDEIGANEFTVPSLMQLYLDPAATNADLTAYGATWEILCLSQGVQADGFADAATALNTAFGAANAANLTAWLATVA